MNVLALALAVLLTWPMSVSAQALTGLVTDFTQTPLPGVTVRVTGHDLPLDLTTATDSAGRYAFAAVPRGRFTVTFTMFNFAELRRLNVEIALIDHSTWT